MQAFLEGRRANKQERQAQQRAINWTAGATVAIAFFAFVSMVVGVAQWETLSGTLDEMHAEQRPWVSVKVLSTSSTLKEVGDNFQVFVRYHLENVGKLPATRVFFYAKLVPANSAADFREAIADACNAFIEKMDTDINSAGVTIFPGQPSERDFGSDETPVSDFMTIGPRGPVMLLAVCAVYRFQGDGGRFHYTPAAYVVGATGTPGSTIEINPSAFPPAGLDVQIRQLAQGNLEPT